MNKLFMLLFLVASIPGALYAQDGTKQTTVKTMSGDVKVPGDWQVFTSADDSGQTYLKNKEEITIAIAQNPKKMYSFFNKNKSAFENVKLFYFWDSDYRKEMKFKTDKIKEDSKLEYVIWKYTEDNIDNFFLFGSSKENFLNLLVYTDKWSDNEKILFLENTYKLNK